MEKRTTRIGEYEITLALPASFAVRNEISRAWKHNETRAACAALGACWHKAGRWVGPLPDEDEEPPPAPPERPEGTPKGLPRPSVDYYGCKCDPMVYGGAVLDELVGRGLDPGQVFNAGVSALLLISDHILSEKEVKAAEDFTPPRPDGSTG